MISLYLHIPFCKKKCYYCDFCSYTDLNMMREYIDNLIQEMILYSDFFEDKTVSTIFVGGGTPSLLSDKNLNLIFKSIYKYFNVQQNAEITIESNPESVSDNFLKSCMANGINRLSIGIQSLNDFVLKSISRIHNGEIALNALEKAINAGFSNINVDLMYGLPNQDLDIFVSTIKKILSYDITHISAYNLIVEDKTAIKYLINNNKISIPNEDLQIQMYRICKNFLEDYGFKQYEISNYSKPGFECKHNLTYWEHNEYLGLGVSSHSFLKKDSNMIRFYNSRSLKDYYNNVKNKVLFPNAEVILKDDLMFERIMLGFRLTKGLSISRYNRDFSCDFLKKYNNQILELKNEGLIEHRGDTVSLSPRGLELENQILLKFM